MNESVNSRGEVQGTTPHLSQREIQGQIKFGYSFYDQKYHCVGLTFYVMIVLLKKVCGNYSLVWLAQCQPPVKHADVLGLGVFFVFSATEFSQKKFPLGNKEKKSGRRYSKMV